MIEYFVLLSGILTIVGIFVLIVKSKNNVAVDNDLEKLKQQAAALHNELLVATNTLAIKTEEVTKLQETTVAKEREILDVNNRLAMKTADYDNLLKKLQEQKEDIERLQEKFRIEFRNLANEILEEKTQKFTEQNRVKLDELLKPLGEKIRDFEKKVEETYQKESNQRFSLEKEIKNLAELNQQISADARNLTTALKSDSKKQGNWGELVLERVLESSGLVKGQEYVREYSTRSDEGDRYRPDVVVNLPDNKHIIIDSKVSLLAYNDFVASESSEERERHMRLHLLSIRNHIKMLGEKNYQMLGNLDTPDYVLLFIPIESSFSVAIQADAELFAFAWERNVVIVSPTTLLATLKTVASIWKHEKQTRNAIEIARQGGLLYDKFVAFLLDLEKIGNQIDTVRKTYDEAHKKLSSGTGNLVGRVEKLRELGAKTSKDIPRGLLENTDHDDE